MRMIRPLTDRQMLTAARGALEEHLAMRPLSAEEATLVAAQCRAGEVEAMASADRLGAPEALTRDGYPDRGAGVREHDRCLARLDALDVALRHRLHAEAYERVAASPVGAWEDTARELRARVLHYARLVGSATRPSGLRQ